MYNIWSFDRGANRQIGFQTARIEQTIEAARHSLGRVAQMRDWWARLGPDARPSEASAECLNELAIAVAYDRELRHLVAQTCRGLICVPRWADESRAIHSEIEAAVAWARSAGVAGPRR